MLTLLPEELVLEILQWLPAKSLVNMLQVSKGFYRIGMEKQLWLEHQDFPYRLQLKQKNGEKTSWSAVVFQDNAPPARLCHTAVIYGNSMYINGGHNTVVGTQLFQDVKADFWRLDLETRKWEDMTQPHFPNRTEHSAVVWGNKLWLFGGFASTAFNNDVVCYDFDSKEMVPINPRGMPPSVRSAHVAIAAHGKMWVFGGWNGTDQNNELHSFDFNTHEWRPEHVNGPIPAARCSHAATYVPAEDSFFIYGGYGGRDLEYLADLWQFSFATRTWKQVSSLTRRSRMRMVEHRNKLYIYGGWNSKEHFADFHEYDIRRDQWRQIDIGFGADEGRTGQFSMCVHNKFIYAFAGYDDYNKTSCNEMQAFRMGRPDLSDDAMQCD